MSLFKPRSGHFRPIAFLSIPVFFFMLFFFFGSTRRWGRERQRGYNDKDKCDGAIPIPIPLPVMDEATDMGESVGRGCDPSTDRSLLEADSEPLFSSLSSLSGGYGY